MLTLAEAQQTVLTHAILQPGLRVPLDQSLNQVLASDIESPVAIPPFANSAMDGYAIHTTAQTDYPCQLPVIGTATAGHIFGEPLPPGQAIKIMTGAQVPSETTAVVPWEDTRPKANAIEILSQPHPGQHIRQAGEDFTQGTQLMRQGQILTPTAIGLLATIGLPEVWIYAPVKVGILATGSELLPVTAPVLEPGKIRDSNSYTLAALVQQAGGIVKRYGIVPDKPEQIERLLAQAITDVDMLITSGGVSVGEHDYVQEVLKNLGFEPVFWKVAIKPGKPILFGTLSQKLVFGLPGNPGAAVTGFEQLVWPALRKMMGHQQLFKPTLEATLTHAIAHPGGGRLHLVRCHLRQHLHGWEVTALPHQGSGNLFTVMQANAVVPVDTSIPAGQSVQVQVLTWPEENN